MSMAQFVSVLDVSDAESDNGIKRGVWSNVTVWFYLRRRLAEDFCEFVLDFDLPETEPVGPFVFREVLLMLLAG